MLSSPPAGTSRIVTKCDLPSNANVRIARVIEAKYVRFDLVGRAGRNVQMILDLNLRRRHLISGECECRTVHDGSALDGDHLARRDRDACEESPAMYGAGALLCLRIEPATHRSQAPRGLALRV